MKKILISFLILSIIFAVACQQAVKSSGTKTGQQNVPKTEVEAPSSSPSGQVTQGDDLSTDELDSILTDINNI